jgi:peptidoglycan/LPS O-acetylase OafA/YrhL
MHKTQLDTLRFFAFLLVFFYHAGEHLGPPFQLGEQGVDVFFVLSGFLITRLLLTNETGHVWQDLKTFYVRRVLRIFPLYYGMLFILLSLHRLPQAIWHFLYCSNIQMFLSGKYNGDLTHFWSLCVEEQFYLTFPILLLLGGDKLRRLLLIVVMIVVSDILCHAYFQNAPNTLFWYLLLVRETLPWGCLAGCLELAPLSQKLHGTKTFFIGLAMLIAWCFVQTCFVSMALKSLSLAMIVFGLWRTSNRHLLAFFCWPVFVYLGRISYGLYVFHNFAWSIRLWLASFFPAVGQIDSTLCAFLITVMLAVLSWHLLEGPANQLKRFFPYAKQAA